ncbi:Synaptic vesicle glycoprotein 2C, partial [Apostichopus japonicus]
QLQNPSSANYEVALKETGFGRFNYLLLALCGWAQISDSVEILSVSFLLPVASKDLGLSDVDKGILNSIIFIGMMVGGYMWGALADIKGRKGISGLLLSNECHLWTLFQLCSVVLVVPSVSFLQWCWVRDSF